MIAGSSMVGAALLAILLSCYAPAAAPNVVLILADDLGFSDLGCYGSEVETPHLDALANQGLRYSQAYNTSRCWPTRAALLTGHYAQQVNADAINPGDLSGPRPRPTWCSLLPEMLSDVGYRSYHSGKWHLHGEPVENGFERSYRLTDCNRHFSPKKHDIDGEELPQPELEDGYYSTTAITDHLIRFLEQHRTSHRGTPFFAYVAYTTPHFPLQALPEDISKCATRYGVGWDVIRSSRLQALKSLSGLPLELSPLEPRIGPPQDFPTALKTLGLGEVNRETHWKALGAQQRVFQSAKMAVHAAMVERIDLEVGRIVHSLQQSNELENTAVFFLSDNGASAEIMVRGDGHRSDSLPGTSKSYLCLGPGWSRASNTPFRRHKTWVHEGGIATPLIVHWPKGISTKGAWRHRAVCHVIDIAPTVLEIAGGEWPERKNSVEVPKSEGRSIASTFLSDVAVQRESLWWFHSGNRALRHGDWKLVADKGSPLELYDLSKDRTELEDLAEQYPAKTEELEAMWEHKKASIEELDKRPPTHNTVDKVKDHQSKLWNRKPAAVDSPYLARRVHFCYESSRLAFEKGMSRSV